MFPQDGESLYEIWNVFLLFIFIEHVTNTLILFFRYRAPEVLLQSSAYTPAIGDLLKPLSCVLLTFHLLDSIISNTTMHNEFKEFPLMQQKSLQPFLFFMPHSVSCLFDLIPMHHNSTSTRSNNLMLLFVKCIIFLFGCVIYLPHHDLQLLRFHRHVGCWCNYGWAVYTVPTFSWWKVILRCWFVV